MGRATRDEQCLDGYEGERNTRGSSVPLVERSGRFWHCRYSLGSLSQGQCPSTPQPPFLIYRKTEQVRRVHRLRLLVYEHDAIAIEPCIALAIGGEQDEGGILCGGRRFSLSHDPDTLIPQDV